MSLLKKIYFPVLLILMLISSTGYSQYQNLGNATRSESQSRNKPNPWFVGGMLGGSFSSGGGSFEVSPLVGYKITEDFHVGSRITYIYSSYDYPAIGRKRFSNYGASLFARHRFLNMLFAHVEYEMLNIYWPYEDSRGLVSSLFVGGGLYQQMGGRGFATIAILYNVLETDRTPYISNPIIRVGFGVGL
ncbi:MAG: hypothetical protein HQ521_18985 [Bacteroidetes bacterium]|nr:hypothetical protein [Bacteroidota bacterium]